MISHPALKGSHDPETEAAEFVLKRNNGYEEQ